jgi:thiamine biosynthesis lipoprotein
LLVAALGVVGCARQPPSAPAAERMWPAMGSFASVAVPALEEARLDEAEDSTRTAISEVEAELSSFIPGGLVARLNAAAGSPEMFPLARHAAAVFPLSQHAHERSGGAFDPTVGPFMHLWGFRGTNAPPAAPDAAALAATAACVGWSRVEWRDGSARLTLNGMRLDFGAVAKGYGVDVAFDRLRAQGFDNVMVNLGGNLRCAGAARPDRTGWVVSVRDPYLPYGEGSVGTLTLTDGRATATSGRYERFVEIAGRRYAHVIDARSGQPVSGMAQVTVVAPTAGEADAISTSLFVLGPAAGATMLRSYPGTCALFIPDPPDGETPRALATPGFRNGFTPSSEWAGRVGEVAP